MAQKQKQNRRGVLRRSMRWGAAVVATTATGAAASGGCAPGGTGGAETARLSSVPVTIRFPTEATPPNEAYLAQLTARVKQKYNDKIQISADPWLGTWNERYEKWTTQALAGDAPDMIVLCCELMRPYFTAGNADLLDPYIRRDWRRGEAEDFYKGMWEGMQLDKKQYGVPVYANTPALFVNHSHLKEAGLQPPPEDWNATRFLDYVNKLNRRDADRWGFMMSNYNQPNRHVLFVWAWGGEVHDPKDGPVVTKLTYDHPKTVEALQYVHDLIWKHRVAPNNDAARGGLGAQAAFEQGKAGVYLDGAHVLGAFLRRQQQDSSFDWDIAMPVVGPGGGKGARIGNDGYMIWKGSKHREETWAVLKEIYTPEVQQVRAEITASRPAVKSAQVHFEKQFPGKNMKVMRTLGETARPDPNAYWKDSSQVNAIVVRHLQATFERNEVSVAEATRLMMTEVRGFYGAK
jgi:ABC-type glycerol-3-phosphate transport system substrate-binding protein